MVLRAACIQTHNSSALVEFYMKVFQHEPYVDGGVDFRFSDEQLTVFKLGDDAPNTETIALIYTVDDVDKEYHRLNTLGLCNNGEPTDKPWGVRSFSINDPDGNTICFTKEIV